MAFERLEWLRLPRGCSYLVRAPGVRTLRNMSFHTGKRARGQGRDTTSLTLARGRGFEQVVGEGGTGVRPGEESEREPPRTRSYTGRPAPLCEHLAKTARAIASDCISSAYCWLRVDGEARAGERVGGDRRGRRRALAPCGRARG